MKGYMMNRRWSVQCHRLPAAVRSSAADNTGWLVGWLGYQQLHRRPTDLPGSRYDLMTSLCEHGDEPSDLLQAGDFLVVGVNDDRS